MDKIGRSVFRGIVLCVLGSAGILIEIITGRIDLFLLVMYGIVVVIGILFLLRIRKG